jgi:hypothetical protein
MSDLRTQMLERGVSDAALDLVLLRLMRGGYAQVEGEGNRCTITMVKW